MELFVSCFTDKMYYLLPDKCNWTDELLECGLFTHEEILERQKQLSIMLGEEVYLDLPRIVYQKTYHRLRDDKWAMEDDLIWPKSAGLFDPTSASAVIIGFIDSGPICKKSPSVEVWRCTDCVFAPMPWPQSREENDTRLLEPYL